MRCNEDQDAAKIYDIKLAGYGDGDGKGFRSLKLEVKLPARSIKPLKIGWGIQGNGVAVLDDVNFTTVQSRH